ncbi:uncharacterized protein LOC143230575 isoform X3 [Tachypleus tridentatus]|uniref:uncharacterized protein LOC143230575 isoform X3 n=1 Tax=Tachypleus tridentatus TaxID=6853 RepID=UPI003FD3FDCD
MQSCLELHHLDEGFVRCPRTSPLAVSIKEENSFVEPGYPLTTALGGSPPSSGSSTGSGSFYGGHHCYFSGKNFESFTAVPRLGVIGSGSMYSKTALVWPPPSDTYAKSAGFTGASPTASVRPVSPSSGLVHWMSMMADHAHVNVPAHPSPHDVHYMWNGIETKMNNHDQNNTPPVQKGPVSMLEEGRSPPMESPQMHSMYGSHGNRNGGSPPVSSPSSGGSMLVVPQPINAAIKSSASINANNATTNGTGRKYQCKMCPQIFIHKSAMQHHAREAHRGEVKPHQCQQCLKTFSSNHQLTQHLRVHTGEKPYKCSYCERRFKQLSHVQQHTRLHTGERPYKCHILECGRAFIQLSNLQQHLRNHDNQVERLKSRPFHCNICGKGFVSESNLRAHHSKQHASLFGGPSSQSCPVCHKICMNGEALMDHMRVTHKDPNASGIPNKRRTTNHHCPVCGKSYVNEGSLRKHISSHPESTSANSTLRVWPCSVCQSVFTQENGLLHHMEQMRMDPKHQFAAQYVLSRAAAERREKEAGTTESSNTPTTMEGIPLLPSNNNGNHRNLGTVPPTGGNDCSGPAHSSLSPRSLVSHLGLSGLNARQHSQ